MPTLEPLPVALFGATGAVGQRFATLLDGHPWFRLERLFASERSAGSSYAAATHWVLDQPLPSALAERPVEAATPSALAALAGEGIGLAFSALDARVAGELEQAAAAGGVAVFSNAASHRMRADVPLVVPEVNPEHLALAAEQRWGDTAAGSSRPGGRIVTNPNCSTIGLTLALAPLVRRCGLRRVQLVSLQALSGAGLVHGRPLELADNVIPHIAGEEAKLAEETRKILGRLVDGAGGGLVIEPSAGLVSATCTRVPVSDGHTLCVSIELEEPASGAQLRDLWSDFRGRPQELGLPSAPRRPVHFLEAEDAPQPLLHRDLEAGMAASVGRLRREPLFGEPCGPDDAPRRGWKFVTLSHNTLRGAAGGSLLNAELARATGLL